MPTRMTTRTVTFQRPFLLTGFDKAQAPGSYIVETEEEQIDTVSFPAWKRTGTIIRLGSGGATEYQPVDPDELQEALLHDGAQERTAMQPGPESAAGRSSGAPRLVRRKKF